MTFSRSIPSFGIVAAMAAASGLSMVGAIAAAQGEALPPVMEVERDLALSPAVVEMALRASAQLGISFNEAHRGIIALLTKPLEGTPDELTRSNPLYQWLQKLAELQAVVREHEPVITAVYRKLAELDVPKSRQGNLPYQRGPFAKGTPAKPRGIGSARRRGVVKARHRRKAGK